MKRLLTSLAISCIATFTLAQDLVFTQPSTGIISDNTSWIGKDSSGRLSGNYRNQWSGLVGSYVSQYVQYNQFIPLTNAYVGLGFTNDIQSKTIYTKTANLYYNQLINIGSIQIRPSFQVSYQQRAIDKSFFTFDHAQQLKEFKKNYFMYDVGIATTFKGIQLGFAVHQYNEPNQSLILDEKSLLPKRYSYQFAYTLPIFTNFKITPFSMLNYQNKLKSINIGLDVAYNNYVNFYVLQRVNDFINATGAGVGYENRFFRINYSYEYTISRLTNVATKGSHEVSFSVKLWNMNKSKELVKANSIFSR